MGGTGRGTRQTINSITPSSSATLLKRAINSAFMLAILPTCAKSATEDLRPKALSNPYSKANSGAFGRLSYRPLQYAGKSLIQKDNSPPIAKNTDLAGHTPMMAQYRGVTSFASGFKELFVTANFTAPS